MIPSLWSNVSGILAQTTANETPTWNLGLDALVHSLLAVCIFSLVGVTVLAISVWVMCRVVPFSMRKEIEEDQNVAIAIVMGAIILGISIIIAASVVG